MRVPCDPSKKLINVLRWLKNLIGVLKARGNRFESRYTEGPLNMVAGNGW